jgi:riboflavin kinase/FMN adenylyltransferase
MRRRPGLCLRLQQALRALTADAFVERIVLGLGVRHLMIGDDFRFGKGRSGDFALLQQAGKEHGFGVEAMETLVHEGERVSSSAVREALDAGDLEHAERLLGRPIASPAASSTARSSAASSATPPPTSS